MANLVDLAPLLTRGPVLRRGTVAELRENGTVRVALGTRDAQTGAPLLDCEVLNPDTFGSILSTGDAVLVWAGDAPGLPGEQGIVIGRIGAYDGSLAPVSAPAVPAQRPAAVVIEAEGDLILRNRHARIRLGADGDVEIACASFATRSRRLLRLLAPLIKLN